MAGLTRLVILMVAMAGLTRLVILMVAMVRRAQICTSSMVSSGVTKGPLLLSGIVFLVGLQELMRTSSLIEDCATHDVEDGANWREVRVSVKGYDQGASAPVRLFHYQVNKYMYKVTPSCAILFVTGLTSMPASLNQTNLLASRLHNFNFFAVTFENTTSDLWRRAHFVDLSIQEIAKLQSRKKSCLFLVGSQEGGMTIKSLFASPHFESNRLVSLLVALDAPQRLAFAVDHATAEFYDQVNTYWNKHRNDAALNSVTLVTLAGGQRQVKINPGLARSDHADVNAVATSTPAVRSSPAGHLHCSKEIVKVLARALSDSVTHPDRDDRRKIFEYHFVKRSAGKRYSREETRHPGKVTFDEKDAGMWVEASGLQFVFAKNEVFENTHILIPVRNKREMLVIDAFNFEHDNWIFGCKDTAIHKGVRKCKAGINMSRLSYIIPSSGKRKTIRLVPPTTFTDVVVFVPKEAEDIRAHVEVFPRADRLLRVHVPPWFTFWTRTVLVERTEPNAIFYSVALVGLKLPWQAYDISFTPGSNCFSAKVPTLIQTFIPWSNEGEHILVKDPQPLTVRLQTPRPRDVGDHVAPEIHFYLNPGCQLEEIAVAPNPIKMSEQLVQTYAPLLLSTFVAVLVLSLAQQVEEAGDSENGYCPSLVLAGTRVNPVTSACGIRILSSVLEILADFAPTTDLQVLANEGLDFWFLPFVAFLIASGAATGVIASAWICVLCLSHAINKTISRFVSSTDFVSDLILEGLSRLPVLLYFVSVATAAASSSFVAGIGVCVVTSLVQLCRTCEDYLKELLKDSPDDELKRERVHSVMNFQFSVTLLWTATVLLNAWVLPDPEPWAAMALAAALPVLWAGSNDEADEVPRDGTRLLVRSLRVAAALGVTYASVNVYRLNYVLCFTFWALSVHQLLARRTRRGSRLQS